MDESTTINLMDYVPFKEAVSLLEINPKTFKTNIRYGKVSRIPNPMAPGRFLYSKADLTALKQSRQERHEKKLAAQEEREIAELEATQI